MGDTIFNPDRVLFDQTLLDVLQRRAILHPHKVAFTFLAEGEREDHQLTYTELDQTARMIGAKLQSQAMPGDRVLLIFPPGLEYISAFMGCVYGGVIPVPIHPPDPTRLDRTLPRLMAISSDAQACAALTLTEYLEFGRQLTAGTEGLSTLQWIASDTFDPGLATDWRQPHLTPDSLAFIQYTSGSTGTPRGVMVSNLNLIANLHSIKMGLRTEADTRIVCWLPLYHDLGLVANVLQTLFSGSSCILLSPIDFLRRPARWLEAITRYKADISMAPNFAYDLCVRKVSEQEKERLDLSCWRVAGNGGEPVRLKTLERFHRVFRDCGFRFEAFNPVYGLAESVVAVSCKPTPDAPLFFEGNLVSCGRYSWQDQKILIVDPSTLQHCEKGKEGEIWIASSSVSPGYWNRPEENSATFGAFLADSEDGPFLRTGDLGYVRDGQLFITGRLKDLIIIRGNNYYPQDIELSVEESSPALRPGCCAAFSVVIDEEEHLVVAQEVHKETLDGLDVSSTIRAMRHAVSRCHELQIHTVLLLKQGCIPKTSSGKIRRRKCKAEYLSGKLDLIASESLTSAGSGLEGEASLKSDLLRQLEVLPLDRQKILLSEHIRKLLADVFKLPSSEIITEKQRISELGLEFHTAVTLRDSLQQKLGCTLRSTVVFDYPTVESLAAYLINETLAPK